MGLSVDNELFSYGDLYSCAQIGGIGILFRSFYSDFIWTMVNFCLVNRRTIYTGRMNAQRVPDMTRQNFFGYSCESNKSEGFWKHSYLFKTLRKS